MSSLVRRIQKNIARSQGYYRDMDGNIRDSNNDIVGKHWPQVAAPTNRGVLPVRKVT